MQIKGLFLAGIRRFFSLGTNAVRGIQRLKIRFVWDSHMQPISQAWHGEATAAIATIIMALCFCRCILEKDIQRCWSLWRRGMALGTPHGFYPISYWIFSNRNSCMFSTQAL